MISPALQAEIEKQIGQRIVSVAPLSAANNAQIYRLKCEEDGESFVAKVAEKGLDTEAWMLHYLRERSQLPIPEVLYSNEHVIIMEFVAAHHSLDAAAQKDAAEKLAGLHRVQGDAYGFERDNLIGGLPQPNPKTKDWTEFFAQHRLLHMARAALKEGKVDAKFMALTEKLAKKLPQYLKNPAPPSLIHGDVWSGNVLPGRGKIAAFLDPSIYYADPEIELAFIRLFNTFDDAFFTRYGEIIPPRPGFAERAEIYTLYPLLVHTRLFGPSYARKALRVLEKFV